MKLMALELDDRDKMVIRFFLFCKREITFEATSGLQGLETKFLIEFYLEVPLITPVIARAALY